MSNISEENLEVLLERAAEKGAQHALEKLGLNDHDAVKDIMDLRALIGDWRNVKGAVFQMIGKVVGLGILGLIAIATGQHYGLFK